MPSIVPAMLPLDGITVVSLEQAVAAPFATRQLADAGARVIKVERPGSGDFARGYDRTVHGQSSHFVWLNRSKESLALDLKTEPARAVLWRLLETADVFLHNLAPGAVDRLGFGADVVRARNQRLIVCEISGYGAGGPYGDKKAYDLLIQCESGVVSVTGTPDTPSKSGISIADIASGMYAYSGVLQALLRRAQTGEGAAFEVSMLEALGEWMSYPAYFAAYGGSPPPRTGAAHATIYPYGPFAAGDGKSVFFGIQNEREWAAFCTTVLERPELGSDDRFTPNPQRVANRQTLAAIFDEVFGAIDSAELTRRLDEAQIANARLNSPTEFWKHPQLVARGRKRSVGTPGGPVDALLPPVTIGGEPRMDPVPAVGEHTDAILAELGLALG